MDRRNVTVEDLEKRIAAMEQMLVRRVNQGERLEAVVMALLAFRVGGDPSLVTVREAVAIEERLYGRSSLSSVKRKIDAGTYHLEKRAGEKGGRIRLDEILRAAGDYRPMEEWRTIHEAKKRSG